MEVMICLILGYFLGCFNPAALIAKWKHLDLRREGTGNLGATNAMLVLGKGWGALVMAVDVLKAYVACQLAAFLFPRLAVAGLLAGGGAMLGHIFPFYLGFRGGKGLASFAGTILAHDSGIFWLMLVTSVLLMLVFNYTVAVHLYAGFSFPILVALQSRNALCALVAVAIGALLLRENWYILGRVRRGEDVKVRDFLRGK